MNKIEEAQKILEALGMPKAQQNEMAALTLLALCNIKESDSWAESTRQSMPLSKGIMTFVSQYYQREYAPNTRETFRRQVLHQFIQARIVDYNPDEPTLPTNSPKTHYAISQEALLVIKAFKSENWEERVANFIEKVGTLSDVYQRERAAYRLPISLKGETFNLSSGKHNEVQIAVIEQFVPHFVAEADILYLGDTARKDLYSDKQRLEHIGISLDLHSKFPDLVIYDKEREWLFLIEVVTSHGPISPKRMLELEKVFANAKMGKIFVTAFPDKTTFKKYITEVAWETEVWIADNPTHMIHFNGDRFMGPRDTP
ncbi:MAG: BsuBI/PstI family type II restriction endonuclease [Capnocytophaga gingivalis]|uniref:BsuBI/PstI family type II restriction endonuclease n=1 Tax=Capnocytophaga gingivalis TaxID=1017 RepID=UPI00288B817C|nr:BsuBI/PstI family type II restriction endonuclease [Capnocytophaga gingivalis]